MIAINEPKALAQMSKKSNCVLAPQIGLNSSRVNIENTRNEIKYTHLRPCLGFFTKIRLTTARLIRNAAKKLGRHPVNIWPISELFTCGRRSFLFNVTSPNNAANKKRFPRIIFSLFLLSTIPPSIKYLVHITIELSNGT